MRNPVAFLRAAAWSRFPLAIAAGVILALSFPNVSVAGFAWIAPALFVLAAAGTRGWEAFRIGWVGALAHYLVSLQWLLWIPYRWHGIPFAPAAGLLSLSCFLALFQGGWVWFMASSLQAAARGSEPPAGLNAYVGNPWMVLPASWGKRQLWAISGAAAWVTMEMIIARIFTGFPWNLLGASQYEFTPLIQVAEFTGIYGVAFLLVWTSLALLSAVGVMLKDPGARSKCLAEIVIPVLTVAVTFAAGFRQIRQQQAEPRSIDILLIQPSIPQTVIWDPNSDDTRFNTLVELTAAAALTNHADLVIWPEAAVPKLLRYDPATFSAVTNLAGKHKTWMIVGSDDAEPKRETPDPKDADYFNSSFLISPDGELIDRYKKRNLVIFGEYVPLVKWLPFLSWFTPVQGGFTSGDRASQFKLSDNVQTSVLICFEDVFAHSARFATTPETDFFVNITNDGWFGERSAQMQHTATAVFRTVENRRPLVRCTNNGITCWIDTNGRLREIFRDQRGTVYGAGIMPLKLPLSEKPHPTTFYTRYGDVFGWLCVLITTVQVASRVARAPRFRKSSPAPLASSESLG